ncbi:hypothetical protein DYB25_013408, partial [Aphanomyces astaci]
MLTLGCVVVNDGCTFAEEIDPNNMVDQLKDKIKAKMGYSFPAPELTLYVAKMDAAWLQDDCESDAIKPYLIEANKMKPLHQLCSQRFNFTEGMDEGDIHVVVEVPPHRWNELQPGGEGGVIPFADGVEGLGKSTLGRHYVRRSRKEWKYRFAKQPTVFEEALGTCHTVHLESARGQLLTPSFDAVLIHMLVEKLRGMFANPPAILASPPASVFAFLDRLTDEVDSLFLVLDEIGAAFTDASLSDLDSHERFIAFCDDVVCQWCDMPYVFFVLVGRGSFLGLVETNMTTMRKYFLCRFGLNRLRPPDIKTIMQRTFIEVGGPTIQEACAVDDTQLEGVAQRLFDQTCGHPGALVEAFKTCASYSALMAYRVPADAVDQALVFDMLTKHKAVVGEMLMKMLR